MGRIGQVLAAAVVLGFLVAADASSSQFRPRSGSPVKGYGGGEDKSGSRHRPWLCCDRCGGCTKSNPPRCQCHDLVRACHPLCKNCVQSPLSVEPPMYQCMDRVPNYCKRTCTPRSLAGA